MERKEMVRLTDMHICNTTNSTNLQKLHTQVLGRIPR